MSFIGFHDTNRRFVNGENMDDVLTSLTQIDENFQLVLRVTYNQEQKL